MNKIKKIWNENRVLLVLAIVLIACLVICVTVALTYFYGSSDSVYGNRLSITEKVPLNEKLLKDIEKELMGKENVKRVSTNLKGKVVYINISYNDGVLMEDAKKIAEEALPLFNEDELEVYDIQFTINTNEYTLMGSRNSSGSGIIVWNNYIVEESSAE